MNGTEAGTPPLDLAHYRMTRTDAIIHPETRALLAYWQRLRAGRRAPFRAEIDPRDMACEARHLFIIETLADGSHRFRLAGSQVIDSLGLELRGMTASTIMEGRARETFAALIAETLAEPGIGYARLVASDAPDETWELLLLPLRSEDGRLDRLIGLLHPLTTTGPRRAGLRFRIALMEVEPYVVQFVDGRLDGAREGTGDAPDTPGFAEPVAAFEPAAPVRLTAIEGGRRPGGRRARPQLRVIKDE